jgi:hypothetical protein
MRPLPRWLFILPIWVIGVVLIVALAFYFAFHAPAITAMVLVWSLLGGGIWAISIKPR